MRLRRPLTTVVTDALTTSEINSLTCSPRYRARGKDFVQCAVVRAEKKIYIFSPKRRTITGTCQREQLLSERGDARTARAALARPRNSSLFEGSN
ncbi:hypothetical protein EVAR_4369_1 [Eumeta japonica]|uniref:Uncharacterized protein n=1 Tax=Eumeta variegata TaxID=151549 RepID=A0A4C1SXJ7_EUMVA|nr:hypothetical protein EVAR_4369_1 [Eumeta japonica]